MDVGTYIAAAPALLFLASATVVPAILFVWFISGENVQPYLISRARIEAMARDHIARRGDGAMAELDILEHRAAFRCEVAEELIYRRVAKAVRRMQAGAQNARSA